MAAALTNDFPVFQTATNKENTGISRHTRAQACQRPKNHLSRHYRVHLTNSTLAPKCSTDFVHLDSVGLGSSFSFSICTSVLVLWLFNSYKKYFYLALCLCLFKGH